MRAIKFKGFSKELDKWLYGCLIQGNNKFYISKQGYLGFYACFGIYVNILGFEEHKDISEVEPKSIGQYTGVKDKYSIEIYEGDILSLKTNYDDIIVGFVEFKRGAFCLNSEDFGYDGEFISNLDAEFEIIGNIFKNPELLKSKDDK